MTYGSFVIDVCSHTDTNKLQALVHASVKFWTEAQGYKLVSDKLGSDELRIFKSQIDDSGTNYQSGAPTTEEVGDVILIFAQNYEG